MLPLPPAEPLPVCNSCGRDAVAVIDGKSWCVDCYQACGACCAGDE